MLVQNERVPGTSKVRQRELHRFASAMPLTLATLPSVVAQGESQTLEFKKSTNELHRAGQTLCAFLNTDGGQVLIGVTLRAAWSAFRSLTSPFARSH